MSEKNFIVKEDAKTRHFDGEASETAAAAAHLDFRRIVVHEFADAPEPQAVRFHYREHSKHLSPRRAA